MGIRKRKILKSIIGPDEGVRAFLKIRL